VVRAKTTILTELPKRIRAAAGASGLEDLLISAPLVVAVSGGADSLALLRVLLTLRGFDGPGLHVAHLDHGFRGAAGRSDAEFVRQLADGLGLPYTITSADVPAFAERHGLSDEEAARQVRYDFLAGVSTQAGGTVAVAHNADDQVETVLMSLLRGTGLAGLAGMPMLGEVPVCRSGEQTSQQKVRVYRPLLGVWREEIEQFCREAGLTPRLDHTNAELAYTRNRVRNELLPLLKDRYSPAVKKHLLTLSEIVSADDSLLDVMAVREWKMLAVATVPGRYVTLDPTHLAQVHVALRRRVVRKAFESAAGTLEGFTFEHVEAAASTLTGEAGAPAEVHLPHGLVAYHRGSNAGVCKQEHFARVLEVSLEAAARWPLLEVGALHDAADGARVQLDGAWVFTSRIAASEGAHDRPGALLALFDADKLEHPTSLVLRTRMPGDYIKPIGMSGSKSLQDLYVDAKIPGAVRDRLAVIAPSAGPGEVLWVPGQGGRRSSRAPVTGETRRVLKLEFTRRNQVGGE
jgi:tRNA(Ile)-lysidine synthase